MAECFCWFFFVCDGMKLLWSLFSFLASSTVLINKCSYFQLKCILEKIKSEETVECVNGLRMFLEVLSEKLSI